MRLLIDLHQAAVGVLATVLGTVACAPDEGTSGGDGDHSTGAQGSEASGGTDGTTNTGGAATDGTGSAPTAGGGPLDFADLYSVEDAVGLLSLGRGPVHPGFFEVLTIFLDEQGMLPTLGEVTAVDETHGVVARFPEIGMPSQPPYWDDDVGISGGETFTVTATGGSVEAFTGTLNVPLAPLLTSHTAAPVAEAVAEITVSRTEDLTITWDARQSAQAIWVLPASATATGIGWTFDAGAGAGTLPASDLAQLPPNERIVLAALNRTRVETSQGYFDLWGHFKMVTEVDKADFVFVVP